jgi:hypothetical protein
MTAVQPAADSRQGRRRVSSSEWQVDVERRLIRLRPFTNEQGKLADEALAKMARRSLGTWWTGSSEDLAHSLTDALERDRVLTDTSDTEERRAVAAAVAIRVRRLFRVGDARRAAALELLTATPSDHQIREALGMVHDGWSSLRRSQRAQRNRSLLLSVGFALATTAMAWALEAEIWGFALGAPPVVVAAAVEAVPKAVVANAWVLVLLGVVGGLVSLLPLVRRTPNVARSSGGWMAQALLKTTSGGLLGLLGCWFLQTGVLDLTEPLEAGPLAAWAVLFGYGQDVLTRRFDERLATATSPPVPDAGTDDPEPAA